MAKEFKNYDKIFARYYGELTIPADRIDIVEGFNRWDIIVQSWPQEFVQWAVYHASDFEEWQRYRVGLKGHTTKEKLYLLQKYYADKCVPLGDRTRGTADSLNKEEQLLWNKFKCRIDNYIGALRRGGQLNEHYEVVK